MLEANGDPCENFHKPSHFSGKNVLSNLLHGFNLHIMSPLALQLQPADITPQTEFIIYSPDHGLISEHTCEEEARASFATYLSELEMGEYLPFLLQRSGNEWEIAGC